MPDSEKGFLHTNLTYLKTEASALTPKEDSEIEHRAQQILDTYVSLWGKHMPAETKVKILQISGGIVVADEETLPRIGAYFNVDSEESGESNNSEVSSKEYRMNVFQEAAADFYAAIGCWKSGLSTSIVTPQRIGNINLYFRLLDVFGPALHEVYFGKDTTISIEVVLNEIEEGDGQHLDNLYRFNVGESDEARLLYYRGVAGLAFHDEGLIVLLKENSWERLNPPLQRKLRMKQLFTGIPFPKKAEQRAQKKINDGVLNHRLAHELAHLLQSVDF